jgi:hypothetical protein
VVPRNQSRLIREVPLSDRHNYLSRMTMRADLMQPSWFSDPRSQRITRYLTFVSQAKNHPIYLLFYDLLCGALYCAPGGVRVVSDGRGFFFG